MGTTGSLSVNLNNVRDIVNNSIEIADAVTLELDNNSDIVGLGIAISLGLSLIFGAVFVILNFLPAMIAKFKGLKKA